MPYLESVNTQRSIATLVAALSDHDSAIATDAAVALLARGNTSGMDIASQVLSGRRSASPQLIHNIESAVAEGVKSEDALPLLNTMMDSSSVEERRSAGSCLAHVHSPQSVSLAVQILTDSDRQVRFFGVLTLSLITEEIRSGSRTWKHFLPVKIHTSSTGAPAKREPHSN